MACPRRESALRQTFKVSAAEGLFAQIFMTLAGTGSVFITMFALLLGAGPVHLGILAAMGQSFLFFQPLGVFLTRTLAYRKGIVIKLFILGRFLPFLFGFLPLLIPDVPALWVFLLLFFLSVSLQAVGTNAWMGWISDMVPERIRGRFFSVRSQYLVIGGLVSGYLVGAFLDFFHDAPGFVAGKLRTWIGSGDFFSPSHQGAALAGVFVLAVIMGFVSLAILRRQPEVAREPSTEDFREIFLEPFRDANFRRLLFFGLWWMFAAGIGGPFWQPFMIEKLRLSVVQIQIYGTVSAVMSIATFRIWGRMIDRFGNKPAMRIAILMGGLNPLLWLHASPSGYLIIYIEAAFAGVMWAGAGVILSNFVLSIAPRKERQVYSGLFSAVCGAGMICSMLLSGLLLPPPLELLGFSLQSEQVLFGLTGLARWSALIPLTWIAEPAAKSMGQLLFYYRQFAKVRLIQLAVWAFRRKDGKETASADRG